MKAKRETWRKVMPKKNSYRSRKSFSGLPIVKKIFSDLSKEKTIVFAILLQLFIILTASLLITNSKEIFNPENLMGDSIDIAITGNRHFSSRIIGYFDDDINIIEYDSHQDAIDDFFLKEIDAILNVGVGEEFLPIFIELTIPKGDVKSSMILAKVREGLEIYENVLRENNLAEPDAIMLDRLNIKERANPVATQIYEALYSLLIPFLLLMPGILLGGLVIDILIEELEKKTLNLLMLIISFRRYIFELIIATLTISVVQILLWQFLLAWQGIEINNLAQITAITIMLNFIMFLFCIILTLAIMEKTKSQVIYSFLILLLFATMPLFEVNPIRVITRLAIGLEPVAFYSYFLILSGIAVVLFSSMMIVIKGKEW